ncbi:hypothetical protein PQQ62_13040 [Caballeronia grimmiae]
MQEISQPSILQRFYALKVWQRGDERAPHKPLLALLALGACSSPSKPTAAN